MNKDFYKKEIPNCSPQLRKFLFLFIVMAAAFNISRASISNYTFASSSGSYTAISGTTLFSGSWDDASSSLLTIPFSFIYNSTTYTTLGVASNGFITLGAVPSNAIYCGLQGAPANSIAGYGTDLVGGSGSSNVQYGTRGLAPNRQFVIQWTDVDHWNTGNVNHWTFQIILNETSNTVQVMWGSSTDVTTMGANNCSDVATESGNVGLLGNNSSDFSIRSVTNGTNTWASSVQGTGLTSVCNMSSSNIPASGLTYTWAPGVAVAMTYSSSNTTFLSNGLSVPRSATNNQILQLQIVTSGSLSPFNITGLALSTAGCTNATIDISNAKVYFTGLNPVFSATTQFGSTTFSPNGAYTVSGSATLTEGTNYFWVTYDITSGAGIGDILSGCCTSITGSGTMGTQTPTTTCPSGSQIISAQGTWAAVSVASPHSSGGGMLLLSDGTVLAKSFSGGSDGYGSIYDKLTPDANGSYINGTWTSIAAMHDTRLYYSSQVLKDGRVYAAGGEYGSGGALGETYDPLTNVWTAAPAPGSTVSDANSEILPDGKVLQALVSGSLTGTKIYDPFTNTYANGPTALGIHNESAWVKLPDNSILYVNRLSTSSERYIPSLNQWVADATVPVSLYDPYGDEAGAALLLPDGRAFFLGSTGHTAYYTPSGNNSNGAWAAGPDIPSSRGTPDAPAVMMVNGKILCTVSPVPTSSNHFPTPTYFYEFDYISNTFTQINAPGGGSSVNESCYITNMLDLPNGTVLYATQGSNQFYVYTPGGSPLTSRKPAIGNITQISCSTFSITGTQFNGISEGAAYGDDWQMASNYPIIRLTSGTHVYYVRTLNWNSTGVRRGSLADTTQFTLPSGLPNGTYLLVVAANGISSDPVTFIYPNVSFTGLATTYQPTDPPVTLTGTPSGGTFSGPGISGNTFSPASAGIGGPYTITYTYCSNSYSQQTTVSGCGVAAAGTITGPSSLCAGSSGIVFKVAPITNATSYSWSLPTGASISSGNNTDSITVNFTPGAVSGTLSVFGSNANCSGSSSSKSLTVNPLPAVTASNVSGCSGSPITLSGSPSGGTWSVANPYIGSSTTYTHTYTDANGCTNTSSSATITVNPLPTVTANNVSGCSGTPIALFGTPSGGTWSVTNPYTGSSTTYTHTFTDVNGCSNISSPATITVNPLPTVNAGTYSNVCDTVTSVALNGTPAGGAWSGMGVSGNAFHPSIAGQGTWTITYSYTDGNGCTGSASAQVSVVTCSCMVPNQPVPITGATSFCKSSTGNLYSIAPVGGATSYTWTVPTGGTIASGQGTTSITINFSSTALSGNICVVASNGCGTGPSRCMSVTATSSKPTKPGSITGAINNLCNATNVSYSIAPISGATSYTWTVPSGATIISNNGTSITVNFGNFVSGSVCVTANNACGSSLLRCQTVSGLPATPASITGATSVCAHQSGLNYSCATQPGVTYTWAVPSGATITSGQGTGSITVTWGTANGQVKVTPSNACGNAAVRSQAIKIHCRTELTEEYQVADFLLAPNPTDDIINVAFESLTESAYSIRLMNMLGQIVIVQAGNSTTGENKVILNLSELPKGIYMLELTNGDERGMKKVVLN